MSEGYSKYDDYDEYDDLSDEGLHIDWMGIVIKMLKEWKVILLFCVVFGILGIFSALIMKREWRSTATLAPEVQQRSSSSALSSITSMLGMGNVQLAAGTDALNISLFPTICRSTPFLVGLFDVELTSYVSPVDQFKGVDPKVTTVFDHFSRADDPNYKPSLMSRVKKFLSKEEEIELPEMPTDPTQLNSIEYKVVELLRDCITADVDSKTGVTTISVITDDKMMSRQLADTVCKALQTYFVEYRTKKAKDDYEHYVKLADEAKANWEKAQAAYAASVDSDRNVILQSVTSEKQRLQTEANIASQIYSQMAQQRELARAKIQEEKPVYAVIQPASLAKYPVHSKKKRVLIVGFLGFLLGCCWTGFGKDLWKSFHSSLKGAMTKKEDEPVEKAVVQTQ
ncbi:MAG: hypothetical protein IJL91_10815 [Bacteroidales bacterium]|nr:hypothetical protein [Bacteroidales bacterium]